MQLHEILAVNRTSLVVDGATPDYLELWNPGIREVSLAGWTLSEDDGEDGSTQPTFIFPPDTLLAGQAYRVLTENELGFALDGEGDALFLKDANGRLIDELNYGRQAPDLALGRLSHRASWQPVFPSPGQPNRSAPLGDPSRVHIAEWLGAPEIRIDSDFVELFNPIANPVEISGWTLTDRPGSGEAFPPLSFVGARGRLVLKYVRIDRLRDALFLTDTTGTLRDFVLTDPQTLDRSQRRDGSLSILPTPGTGEPATLAEESRLLALLDGLRISEIMFHPDTEEAAEFIELRNIGPEPLDLAGIRFTAGDRRHPRSWLARTGRVDRAGRRRRGFPPRLWLGSATGRNLSWPLEQRR